MKREYICLVLSLLFVKSVALKSYLYYEDADCVDTDLIQGTLVYTYDDATMEEDGFTIENYSGSCRYLPGGFLDFDDIGNGKYVKTGYCVRCYGHIGCTENKNSCAGFYTLSPSSSSSSYYGSGNSTYGYDDDDDEIDATVISKVEKIIYRQVNSSDSPKLMTYCLLGIFLSIFSLLGLFLICRAGVLMSARYGEENDKLSAKLRDDDFVYKSDSSTQNSRYA